jgi:hypothetical protein
VTSPAARLRRVISCPSVAPAAPYTGTSNEPMLIHADVVALSGGPAHSACEPPLVHARPSVTAIGICPSRLKEHADPRVYYHCGARILDPVTHCPPVYFVDNYHYPSIWFCIFRLHLYRCCCPWSDPNGGGGGRKALIAQLEESLRRLQTEYVDLYWLHGWDRRAPIDETLRALDDVVGAPAPPCRPSHASPARQRTPDQLGWPCPCPARTSPEAAFRPGKRGPAPASPVPLR